MDLFKLFKGKEKKEKTFENFDVKNSNVCMECGKIVIPSKAVPVKDDFVLNVIKSIKQKTKTIKNNKLFICPSCWPEYEKNRKRFVNGVFFWSVLLGVFLVVLLVTPLLTQNSYPLLNVVFLLLGIFAFWVLLMIMQIYSSYRPGTEFDIKNLKEYTPSKKKNIVAKAKKSKKKRVKK
ncbi:hypothetical protein KO465_01745 [Candidatus Micrarchaeota archaeon]|jgi:uncharacterized membrane protein YuzA (DUF378 family)|nr:hypothetical protein [Candidatus Micrarchaeota archaeon]